MKILNLPLRGLWHEGGLESTIFINLIPPTSVAWLLQYSVSRVEHKVGFSSHK